MRVRTVEYDPGWGYIARNPWTGKEVIDGFRWRTRDVARAVVEEARSLSKPAIAASFPAVTNPDAKPE